MNEYSLVHSSRLHEVRHAALPQEGEVRHGTRRSAPTQPATPFFMRHPFISFTAWTTVAAVVLSALWLAMIEEQIRSNRDDTPRSLGVRVAEPIRDTRAQSRRPSSAALATSADPATSPATVRLQTLAWTR